MPAMPNSNWRHMLNSVGHIKEIAESESVFGKFFWAVTFALFLLGCSQQLFTMFIDTKETPYVIRENLVMMPQMPFPEITVCTQIRFDARNLNKANISLDLLSYLFVTFKDSFEFIATESKKPNFTALEQEYREFRATKANNFDLESFFLENAPRCSEIIYGCSSALGNLDCCKDVRRFMAKNGVCLRLNLSNLTQIVPGVFGGIKMALINDPRWYPEILHFHPIDDTISMHFGKFQEGTGENSNNVKLNPGTQNSVRISFYSQNVDPSVSECLLIKKQPKLKYYDQYSQWFCNEECRFEVTLNMCRCRKIGDLPGINLTNSNISVCSPMEAIACNQLVWNGENSMFRKKYKASEDLKAFTSGTACEKCEESCYLDWTQHTKKMSHAPNPGFKKAIIEREPNFTELVGRFSILELYYRTLAHHKRYWVPTNTWSVFIGGIGGTLSLWLGVRLLTFLQIVYYGFAEILKRCSPNRTITVEKELDHCKM